MAEGLSAEIVLALGYAPRELRDRFEALFAFDQRLGANVASAKEPHLARIRLAWWRDEIEEAASSERVSTDPDAAAIVALVRNHDVTFGQVAKLIEGWWQLLDPLPLTVERLGDYASGRGGGIVAAAAAMAGSGTPDHAGEAFALVDFARNCSDAVSRERALTLAIDLKAEALATALRPFALLDAWARRDAALLLDGKLPLSLRRRALSALTFALTGPRL